MTRKIKPPIPPEQMHTMHLVNWIKRILRECRSQCGLTSTPISRLAVTCAYAPNVYEIFMEAARRGDILIWPLSAHGYLVDALRTAGYEDLAIEAERLKVASSVRQTLEGSGGGIDVGLDLSA